MADGDIPLHPCKQPFKECEIRRYDQPESARSGSLVVRSTNRTGIKLTLIGHHTFDLCYNGWGYCIPIATPDFMNAGFSRS